MRMDLSRRQVLQSALLVSGAALVAHPADARTYYWGSLAISDAWAAPTPAGAAKAGVFMIIENRGGDTERLLSVRSTIARAARFIEDDPSSGVIEQIAYIEVRPRRPVALRPGRIHVELQGLSKPLVKGSTFPLTLVFAFAGPVEVPIDVDER
jgi:periplasmic copper chaperone A